MSVRRHQTFAYRVYFSLICCATLLFVAMTVEAGTKITLDVPYYLVEKRDFVMQGERFQVRLIVESNEIVDKNDQVSLNLPKGIKPYNIDKNWLTMQDNEGAWTLRAPVRLEKGYGQWFDLLSLQTENDLSPGTYYITANISELVETVAITVVENDPAVQPLTTISIDKVELPLDKDGKKDDRIQDKSLILRDEKLDYLRNVLQGKGASNLQAEALHPLSYIGVDISNGTREEKMVTVTAYLLDGRTKQKVPGLMTPAATGEEAATAEVSPVNREGSQALVALSGAAKQRLVLPMYVEEKLLSGGKYWLHLSIADAEGEEIDYDVPIVLVKKNQQAMITVIVAVCFVLMAGLVLLPKIRHQLHFFKTRWLITISLFSTATFATVNVPSTLIGDFLHVILGPFSFLITGLFNGVVLYMLLISLLMLIPHSGVISLYMFIRLLLNVFAFGHLSVLTVLSYSLQSLFLELSFFLFNRKDYFLSIEGTPLTSLRKFVPFALSIGVADSVSTYANMQAMTIFYRLYYADWYIALVVLFNGLLFTVLGVLCGILLGRQVQKIKGD